MQAEALRAGELKSVPPVQGSSFPQLKQGIAIWPLFPARGSKRGVYIAGDANLDRYIVIGEEKLAVVQVILPMLDGFHSTAEIDAYILREKHKQVRCELLCKQLSEAGLLEGSNAPTGDFTRASVPVCGINIAELMSGAALLPKLLISMVGWLCLSVIVSGLVLIVVSWPQITVPLSAIWAGSRTYLNVSALLVYFVTFVIATFSHELAHGITAAYFGLIASRIEISLYLGIIPMVYLRIPGLYTVSPARRVIIWSAGAFVNLTFAAVGMIVLSQMHHPAPPFLAAFILINYTFALTNLIPFLPSDGYFICSTIFRLHNVRRRSTYQLIRSVAERKLSLSTSGALYLAATAILIGFAVWRDLAFIFHLGLHHKIASALLASLFFMPWAVYAFKRLRRTRRIIPT